MAQEMATAQPVQPEQANGGASQLAADIHSKMTELMDLMSGSNVVDDADKQDMASVISHFRSVIENLGQAPGAKAPQPKPVGQMPMEMGPGSQPLPPGA